MNKEYKLHLGVNADMKFRESVTTLAKQMLSHIIESRCLMLKRWRMIMLCGSISVSVGTLVEWMIKGTIKPLTLVITAASIATIVTLYKTELKELIDKIKGDDDDFGNGNFG